MVNSVKVLCVHTSGCVLYTVVSQRLGYVWSGAYPSSNTLLGQDFCPRLFPVFNCEELLILGHTDLVFTMAENDGFDLLLVKRCFEEAKQSDDQILLQKYLEGFKEIDRFFCMMGTLFSFIARDITEKSRILQQHASEHPDEFVSAQSIVDYEVSNDLTRTKTASGLLSGSRTLLRLHRSLLFFANFLGRVTEIDDEARCSKVASEVYSTTLGNFHPWLIRQAAYLAMRSLPVKKVLVRDYIKQGKEEAEELVPQLVKSMLDVHEVVQSLYSANNILELP